MVAWEEIEKTNDIVVYDTLQYLRDGTPPPVAQTPQESPAMRQKRLYREISILFFIVAGVVLFRLGKAMGWW